MAQDNEFLKTRSPILEMQKKKVGEHLRLVWGFDKWYEKIIMVGLGVLGLWKLLDIIKIMLFG